MVIFAILNGVLRAKTYSQLMNELSAHQLSTLIGLIFFGLYIWFLTGVFQIETSRQAFAIGAIWFIMTIVFESLGVLFPAACGDKKEIIF